MTRFAAALRVRSWFVKVPVMTGPLDPASVGGRLMASHADIDRVIDTLQSALPRERLTREETGGRAERALAVLGRYHCLNRSRAGLSRGKVPPRTGQGGRVLTSRVTDEAGGSGADSSDVVAWQATRIYTKGPGATPCQRRCPGPVAGSDSRAISRCLALRQVPRPLGTSP